MFPPFGEPRVRKVLTCLIAVLASLPLSAAIRSREHPSIHAYAVGKETGRSGQCAASSQVLVCIFDYPYTAVRLDRMTGRIVAEGTWEPIVEPDEMTNHPGAKTPGWVRVCIAGDCEVWPASVFAFKTHN